ncbi:cyclase family protein [Leptolyngbya cf. ectocarpi LEGE 11479]|uniref:Cyclase family protein n=2 Tax=Leptolyngbya ectocarpi TaxID=1202 RepID=A0A928ZVG2_LEPEC|nr:cyclase family protein [Leptolyngbya cf. ectocarpi LEGE 11479]
MTFLYLSGVCAVLLAITSSAYAHQAVGENLQGSDSETISSAGAQPTVGKSPWGPDDELGRLNLMTDESRAAVLSRVAGGNMYDLAEEYFMGMPGWFPAGDPRYNFWMTHTPRGTIIADPMNVGQEMNEHVSYTGSAFSMYSHTGTHIDALNHFGLNGEIYNGFSAEEYQGDHGWTKTGAETIPPIVARGVLIDVAAYKGVAELSPGYRVERDDLVGALESQQLELAEGDVVLIRTGRMRRYDDTEAYLENPPGLGMDGARYLVESGAMIVGADNLSLEAFPSEVEGNYIPVHTYLLAQHGIPIMELVYLEDISKDKIYEFAFIGGSLRLRGADAAPMRPIALPLR